ncbi:baseplate J/gp47 family protein [Candidatus Vondammii sp. HM_W22]|uniref:baseplate J/gp47 family protein n=1 Tax=Candidatus Vondammii sp. HM_W22 TaxID=2687299 RepID=UPI001F137B07|nr:baseplate J/gp47 family protein [Candidatus Vondammii sp. HM_W22]
MPFNRPDLQTQKARIAGDIEARLPGADAKLRRSVNGELARVVAGATHGLYGYLDHIAQQVLPDTADAERLERWASVWKVARRAAVATTGSVDFTGTDGVVIPAGTLLQRSDGVEYSTSAEVTIAASTASAIVTPSLAGTDGNADAGVTLNLVSPIAGVLFQATVAAGGLSGGAEGEDDDGLRSRLLVRIQEPPHGGAVHDYIAWALVGHSDVTRVWITPQELAANGVSIRIMTDDATANANGIPEQAVIDAVQTYIDGVRPVTADPTVIAPVAMPLDLTISGLSPNTQAVKDAVEAEIIDLIQREGEPGGTLLLSHIREAISIAAGEADHLLTNPAADITHIAGQIAVPGVITWA